MIKATYLEPRRIKYNGGPGPHPTGIGLKQKDKKFFFYKTPDTAFNIFSNIVRLLETSCLLTRCEFLLSCETSQHERFE